MDQREFAERVTAMQGSLYRVAASYLRGESDRLDATAEAIAKAWERRQTLRDERLFATWLTRILIRVCVDMQRRQKRMIPTDEVADRPAENENAAALREALESLPQRDRTMIVLHYMEGYDVREIARMMGTTKGAVCAGERKAARLYRGGWTMKKAEWQAVYAPRGDALEKRVKQTLSQLEEKPERMRPKRMVWLAAALVLALAAAAAVAAGLTRSARYDAKRLAHQALEEKYGFTQDMDSFFLCTVEEKDGRTVVTYRANADVGDFAEKLGDYTVTIQNGRAEARWSNDGEAVGDDFSSDVWDTALLARGIARRKAGEEWYEITGETLETGGDWSGQKDALVPDGLDGARMADESESDALKARNAVREKYGLTEENFALFDAWKLTENGKTQIVFAPNIPAEDDGILLDIDDETADDMAFSRQSERMGRYTVELDEDGAAQSVSWTHDGEEMPDVTEATWGRANVYDAKCLTELEKLLADLQALRAEYPDDGWTRTPEGDAALDARRVAAGFSVARYNHVLPEAGMLTEQDALALARQTLEGDGGLSAEALDDPESVTYAVCQKEDGKTVWNVWHHNAEGICVVAIDAADGTILDVVMDTGMAGNG